MVMYDPKSLGMINKRRKERLRAIKNHMNYRKLDLRPDLLDM